MFQIIFVGLKYSEISITFFMISTLVLPHKKGQSKKKDTISLWIPHLTKNHLKILWNEKPVSPLINVLNVHHSECFGGITIYGDNDDLDNTDYWFMAMEIYAKTAMIIFVPFNK